MWLFHNILSHFANVTDVLFVYILKKIKIDLQLSSTGVGRTWYSYRLELVLALWQKHRPVYVN